MSLDRIDRVVLPFFTMGWFGRAIVDCVSNALELDFSLVISAILLVVILYFMPKD